MNTQDFIKRLQRYQQGKSDPREQDLVDRWYDTFPAYTDIPPLQEDNKREQLLTAIQHKIAGLQRQAKVRRLQQRAAWRAAAAILLISGAGLFWLKQRADIRRQNERFTYFNTNVGQLRKIVLPDSSEVWMNAATRIRFQGNYGDTDRVVYLDEGEAFFEVTKDRQKPFYVHTPTLHTRVLGTSFDIKSYAALNFTRVSVVTGRVKIGDKQKSFGVYTADQGLTYDRLTEKVTRDTLWQRHPDQWRDGKVQLNQASFNELALAFKNIYRMDLKAGTPKAAALRYTITLESKQPMADALTLINAIHETKTRRNAHELILYP